jgi:hypothetical protein
MVLVRSAKDSVSQANQIRKTNLLKLGWEGLSANVLRQRRQRSRNQKALHLHRHWFSLRSWMIWQRRCEASEDIKALGSVLKAGRHWKTLLCGKCLKSWKNYVILSKQRRIQWLSASRIYSTRVLTACFGAWLDYVEVERVEQKHVGIAVDFRRRTSLSEAFYNWLTISRLVQDTRDLERMVGLVLFNRTSRIAYFHILCRHWRKEQAS